MCKSIINYKNCMEHVNKSVAVVSYIIRAKESGSGGFMKG